MQLRLRGSLRYPDIRLVIGTTLSESSERLVSYGMGIINQQSDLYTFDGPNGVSDIDVTAAMGQQ